MCCFKCFSWLLPLARPPSEPLPAGALGGAGSPGSAPGAPVVSELELHISMCLPFKFSRCHVFMCMFFFKTKMKTKILEKVKGDSNCKTNREYSGTTGGGIDLIETR